MGSNYKSAFDTRYSWYTREKFIITRDPAYALLSCLFTYGRCLRRVFSFFSLISAAAIIVRIGFVAI